MVGWSRWCVKSIREKNCESHGAISSCTARMSALGNRSVAAILPMASPNIRARSGSARAIAALVALHASLSHRSSASIRMRVNVSSGNPVSPMRFTMERTPSGMRVCLTAVPPVTTMRFVALLVMLMMRQSSGNAGLSRRDRKQRARTGAEGRRRQAKTLDIVSATFLRTDASQSLTKTETPSVCARLPMGCAVGYPFNSTRTTLDSRCLRHQLFIPPRHSVSQKPLWQPPRSWGLSLAALRKLGQRAYRLRACPRDADNSVGG